MLVVGVGYVYLVLGNGDAELERLLLLRVDLEADGLPAVEDGHVPTGLHRPRRATHDGGGRVDGPAGPDEVVLLGENLRLVWGDGGRDPAAGTARGPSPAATRHGGRDVERDLSLTGRREHLS